jgi:multicomponent Na+:H+ antiporter subunit D
VSELLPTERLTLLALLVPFAGAAVIPLFGRWPNLRETVTLVTAGMLCLAVWSLLDPVLGGARPQVSIIEVVPGMALALEVEPLGLLFGLVASSLWIVNSIYSIGYMRANNEPRQTGFYICFAIALGSTIGIAFAKNLFTLFLFYELLTISTYPLVVHKADAEATRAGRLYLLLLLGSSLLLFLPAIVATWVMAGTVDFTPGGVLAGKVGGPGIALLLALYVFGVAKAAVMPMHRWLPAAMVAPTPVSALLHAVAVVKAGVFTILKIAVLIFGIDTLASFGMSLWLTVVAGVTIVVASIIALKQDNLKRRLAYSTVSQLSYVILGVAILAPVSVVGAAIHIAAHAVAKITLFFAAGSIYTAAHLTEVKQLDGIGRRMPWTMGAFAVGTLGMIGVPPTAGFLGKWFIVSGAMQTANWLALGVIAVSTVLNAAYLLPIVFRAFFRDPLVVSDAGHAAGEAPWPMVLALVMTAAATVVLFFWPDVPFTLARLMIGR